MTKKALVLGAGGFIGSHMVKRLKSDGYWVRGVDLKRPEFSSTYADEFIQGDLREADFVRKCLEYKGTGGKFYEEIPYKYVHTFDEVYQFAADMGGAGFVFTGENDAEIMQNSVMINLNVLEQQRLLNREHDRNYTKIFYSAEAAVLNKEPKNFSSLMLRSVFSSVSNILSSIRTSLILGVSWFNSDSINSKESINLFNLGKFIITPVFRFT